MEQKINSEGGYFFLFGSGIGGDGGIRTPDRVIMIHLLCRLSYIAARKKMDSSPRKFWLLIRRPTNE